MPTVNLEIYL